jgi:hypothetical protein
LLAELGFVTVDRFLMILTLSWACIILCAGILEGILSARVSALPRPSVAGAGNGESE